METVKKIKQDILHVCRRIYARDMVAANDGNVSVKAGPDLVISTPTMMSKGFLEPEDLVETDMEGKPLSGESLRVTCEIPMYLRIFRQRPDILAAVHAHPPTVTALAVAGRTVDCEVLPESALLLGKAPLVPYGTPGTEELPDQIEKYLQGHNVFLLENHGALALGRDVIEAYHRMECLEHTAKILFLAGLMGGVNRLTKDQLTRLFEVHGGRVA